MFFLIIIIIKDSSLWDVRAFIIYYMQSTCWTHGKSCKFYCNANNASRRCNLSLLNVLNFISRVVKLEDVLWCSKCFFEATVFFTSFCLFQKRETPLHWCARSGHHEIAKEFFTSNKVAEHIRLTTINSTSEVTYLPRSIIMAIS